jgi:hypothetical protein
LYEGRLGETSPAGRNPFPYLERFLGDRIVFAVGTAHRAGRFTEHGTVRQRATPWLYPAFVARLPRIKQTLRNILVRSFKESRSKV